MGLAELEAQASPEAVRLALRVLESDIAERRWVDQVGYCLTGSDVAALTSRSEQAVSKDRRLLRLGRSDGRPAYPAFQFDGRRQVPGVADVVAVLSAALEPPGVAAWLTASQPGLDGSRPVDSLAAGERDRVLDLAARLAARLSR